MQTKTILHQHGFKISGWDQAHVVKEEAEKLGLLVHADFPGINYLGPTLEFGLLDFHK